MVTTLIIASASVACVALLCFKGVTIHYDKRFTISDERLHTTLTENQVQRLEDSINQNKPKVQEIPEEENSRGITGSMDAVIENLHDIFGPETTEK